MSLPPRMIVLALLVCALWSAPNTSSTAAPVSAAPFQGGTWTTGAQGTLGDVVFTARPEPYYINLATTGEYEPVLWAVILDYNTLTIDAGATVGFANHPTRAPVVIRAVGPIVINGTLKLDGANGHPANGLPSHAEPGPGGFRGGWGDVSTSTNISDGLGPGGGRSNSTTGGHSGSGSHATQGGSLGFGQPGPVYGSGFAMPLVGGSGGSGYSVYGGGAGGGAALIGSDVSVHLGGVVSADGGWSVASVANAQWPHGSGGTLRLVSPIISWSGAGYKLSAQNGLKSTSFGGLGWIRVETVGAPIGGQVPSSPGAVHVSNLGEFLSASWPTVTVLAWWNDATASWVPMDQDPKGIIDDGYLADGQVPAPGPRTLRIEGRNVPSGAVLEVRTTHANGRAIINNTSYTMGTAGTGPNGELWTDVVVQFELGTSAVQVRAILP